MSCLWGWMNVGMNMDVWVRGRWRDLGRMEDGTTWKVSGQQHDDEQAWTDCIMIHFLRYPKGLGGQRQKCVNAQIPIVRSWPWLPGCIGASFEIVEMTSKQGPSNCAVSWLGTGQRVAHPGDHYPPILLVAQHLVSHSGPWHERRFLVTCSLTGGGGHCAHTRMPTLFALYTFRRKERFLMHLLWAPFNIYFSHKCTSYKLQKSGQVYGLLVLGKCPCWR